METVRIFKEGDSICAIIGEMLLDKACGFGSTPAEALRDLAQDIDRRGADLDVGPDES